MERQPPSWCQGGSHPAEDDRLFLDGVFRVAGVITNPSLQPSLPGGMVVRIAAGGGVVQGTTSPVQGKYHVYNDDVVDLAIGAASGANPRFDIIAAVISDTAYDGSGNNSWALTVIQGAPSPSPVDPTLPDSCLPICRVHVPTGTTDLTVAGSIDDLRVRASTSGLPVGTMLAYGGLTAPQGYMICDGTAISRTTYAILFGVIGTAYGAGDGTTTFNIPDKRGRVSVGYGGHAAGRTTPADAMGAVGGVETVTLSTTQIPAHLHAAGTLVASSGGAHTHTAQALISGTPVTLLLAAKVLSATGKLSTTGNDANITFTDAQALSDGAHTHGTSGSTGNTGGGTAHTNMQPFQVDQVIIKF